MQLPYFISLALLPVLSLAGTITFASNDNCEDGTEQSPASDVCTKAPEGSRDSFKVTDMGGCDNIGLYSAEGCGHNDRQAYYSEFDILQYCMAPKYDYTHYAFHVC
ncbi:hypothetical protein DPSP01_012711 [Paraphaeosphaeria sporulosa]|uniref:Uncharacterized protein n=1 Tax=Paraphaeosphaeria sporulosa TaxID=1460663 RepID=A0A177BX06_9PLEO|nr:uncharacterized protein CC84DRAFT_1222921 [Paraphaeosphaeria sporulosa]OAF99218.1 hypothetical protein CC84DRAFT_1222921 [Paraphaeosphaeria sporulosa]